MKYLNHFGWLMVLCVGMRLQPESRAQTAGEFLPGLAVTFTEEANKRTETMVLPNVWLFVPAGKPAAPFVPPGRFSAIWNGFVQLDLRAEYAFQAELAGELKLELNGRTLIETNMATTGTTARSELIRLNKGRNALTVTYRSPSSGDAHVRLSWIPKGNLPQPIPSIDMVHSPNDALAGGNQLRLGRALFLDHRCAKCHTATTEAGSVPELAMDAPSFDGIGSRRNAEWMASWVLDPQAQRSSATMPKLLHGPTASEDAKAVAAFLASLKSEAPVAPPKDADKQAGEKLFGTLHCNACHSTPGSGEAEPAKISLQHVARKFTPGALPDFLRKPSAHYAWIQMPDFKLSDEEASQLASYLLGNADKSEASKPVEDNAILERGRKLVQTTGCLNCHGSKLENQFKAKSLSELASGWSTGCLADQSSDASKAPRFSFDTKQRAALRAFGGTDKSSLSRHVPLEFVNRHVQALNCTECHGKVEGFPALEVLGGKLRPEWAARFMGGDVPYKPRPWLEARMPAFSKFAPLLAEGLAAQHGYSPKTAEEGAVKQELAEVGRKLISSDGGFACVACHAVAKVGATQVFESAGINLAYSTDRLLRPYYERWLLNPLSIDPTTKMPAYFDEEGKSPLSDVLEGSTSKQLDAIWQYMRLGENMPPPPGTEVAR